MVVANIQIYFTVNDINFSIYYVWSDVAGSLYFEVAAALQQLCTNQNKDI